MGTGESTRLLLNKARQFDRSNAERILDYIVRNKSPAEIIGYSSGSDEQIHSLFVEARSSVVAPTQQFQQFPQSQPQLHPSSSFWALVPLPQSQLQFYPSGSFGGTWVSLPHSQPQFDLGGRFRGHQAPFYPYGQLEQLHRGQPQFYPSGIQAPTPPTGPPGAFQGSFPEFFGSRLPFQPLRIPGDGMQSNHRNSHQNVRDSPSSSNVQTRPCEFHFKWGHCHKGAECPNFHVSGSPQVQDKIHSLETLPALENELKLLLDPQKSPLRVELLPKVYFEKYGVPLLVDGFQPVGQESYSLIRLLLQLNNTSVIEGRGQNYIVLVENAHKYLTSSADNFKLVLAPPRTGSNRIFIAFYPESTFTLKDAKEYFSKYGPVNYVRFQPQRTCGHVSFVYPETARLVLSERDERKRHFICEQLVVVEPYRG